MFADVALHMLLELSGQGVWACVRGRCKHRHHRIVGDGIALLAFAFVTVKIIG